MAASSRPPNRKAAKRPSAKRPAASRQAVPRAGTAARSAAQKTHPKTVRASRSASSSGPPRGTGSSKRRAGSRSASSTGGFRWRRLLAWSAAAGIWVILVVGVVIAWYARDLPNVSRMAELTRQPSLQIVDADGGRIAAYGELYGEALTVADLPPHVPQAVLAIEDRRFYSHPGIDPIGLVRAAVVNWRAGRVVQGGSTISQQLAKNIFLSSERTLDRKIQELLLAFWLEYKLTKDQVLALYLNRVYFGAGTYGIDAAARRYFGKAARELQLYEAAMLAGLLRAPSRYNPDLAHSRAVRVLEAMVEAEYISEEEALEAAEARAAPNDLPRGRGRYFGDWAAGQVEGLIGPLDEDLVAHTTLDRRLQHIVEEEVRLILEEAGAEYGVSQAAVVVLSPDGAVRAMVGGRDYGESQFNRTVQAMRQPGSAFKPFVYLAAM